MSSSSEQLFEYQFFRDWHLSENHSRLAKKEKRAVLSGSVLSAHLNATSFVWSISQAICGSISGFSALRPYVKRFASSRVHRSKLMCFQVVDRRSQVRPRLARADAAKMSVHSMTLGIQCLIISLILVKLTSPVISLSSFPLLICYPTSGGLSAERWCLIGWKENDSYSPATMNTWLSSVLNPYALLVFPFSLLEHQMSTTRTCLS